MIEKAVVHSLVIAARFHILVPEPCEPTAVPTGRSRADAARVRLVRWCHRRVSRPNPKAPATQSRSALKGARHSKPLGTCPNPFGRCYDGLAGDGISITPEPDATYSSRGGEEMSLRSTTGTGQGGTACPVRSRVRCCRCMCAPAHREGRDCSQTSTTTAQAAWRSMRTATVVDSSTTTAVRSGGRVTDSPQRSMRARRAHARDFAPRKAQTTTRPCSARGLSALDGVSERVARETLRFCEAS